MVTRKPSQNEDMNGPRRQLTGEAGLQLVGVKSAELWCYGGLNGAPIASHSEVFLVRILLGTVIFANTRLSDDAHSKKI